MLYTGDQCFCWASLYAAEFIGAKTTILFKEHCDEKDKKTSLIIIYYDSHFKILSSDER